MWPIRSLIYDYRTYGVRTAWWNLRLNTAWVILPGSDKHVVIDPDQDCDLREGRGACGCEGP